MDETPGLPLSRYVLQSLVESDPTKCIFRHTPRSGTQSDISALVCSQPHFPFKLFLFNSSVVHPYPYHFKILWVTQQMDQLVIKGQVLIELSHV